MSPPLVVAYALAGRIGHNFDKEPLGKDQEGSPVYLRDIWPTQQEVADAIDKGINGPYEAAVHFTFESTDAMNAAMANEGTGAIMADVANYTTIAPVMQTSEIVTE